MLFHGSSDYFFLVAPRIHQTEFNQETFEELIPALLIQKIPDLSQLLNARLLLKPKALAPTFTLNLLYS